MSKNKIQNKPRSVMKSLTIRFKNYFVPEKVNASKGRYDFGFDNRLPNKLLKWVLDSGTAKLASAKKAQYISANGFVEKSSGEFKINDKQNANQLLTVTSSYLAYFHGYAWRIKRDLNGEVKKVECLAFQDVRKLEDGSFEYNPTYSSGQFNDNKREIIQAFLGPEPITGDKLASVINNGELLYVYEQSADNTQYPIPFYFAGIEDIRTSSELQKFDFETVLNAFVTSGILAIVGEVDSDTKDKYGKTEQDYLTETLAEFTGQNKNSDGLSGRNKLVVLPARTKDEIPVFTQFDSKAILEASNAKRDIIDRAVCRLFEVNPALVGFADSAILGNKAALANASDELTKTAASYQELAASGFSKVLPLMDWKITNFRPIVNVPVELLSALTEDEKRSLIGFAPNTTTDNANEKLLTERLGVGGTTSMTDIVSNATLTAQTKINLLILLFGVSKEDAEAIVNGTPLTE